MRTNLAYIDTAALAAVDREAVQPSTVLVDRQAAQARHKVIAGVAVVDESAAEAARASAIAERKNAVSVFRKDRAQAEESLKSLGLTPMAIVPFNAWKRICTEADLFRLRPDLKSQIGIRVDGGFMLTRLLMRHLGWIMWWSVSSIPIFAAYWYADSHIAPSYGHSDRVAGVTLVACVLIVVAHFVMSCLYDGKPYDYVRRHIVSTVAWMRFGSRFSTEALKVLLPNGTSPSLPDRWVHLVLPVAPAEVQNIVSKARGMDLRVAAAPEAIDFRETPSQIFSRIEAENAERRRLLRADPIIYTVVGSAAVILAQYGEFPVEQMIVDRVMNSEHLL